MIAVRVGDRVALDLADEVAAALDWISATSGAHARQRSSAACGSVDLADLVAGRGQHAREPAAFRGQRMGQQHPHGSSRTPWTIDPKIG